MDHYGELVTEYSEKMINGIYNKDQELGADKETYKILTAAGFDPMALLDIIKSQNTESGGLLSNHPSDEDRVKNIQGRTVAKSFTGKDKREKRFKDMVNLIK